MEFAIEHVDTVIHDCADAICNHWEDVALNQDTVKLDPDWDAYKKLYEAGVLLVVTSRYDEKLVGYSVYIVGESLHYKGLKIAESDAFWLDKEYRKGMTGMKMIKFAEKALKDRDVDFIMSKVKIHRDIGPVFERMGYSPIETVYSKGLK